MAKSPKTESERFWEKVIQPSAKDCWIWAASRDGGGYGQFRTSDGVLRKAHAIAYRELIGPIPEGHELHHDCNKGHTGCLNPFHLTPVTYGQHALMGNSPCAKHARQTHCIHGHALSGNNLRIDSRGERVCKTCESQRCWEYRRRKGVKTRHAPPVYSEGVEPGEEEE